MRNQCDNALYQCKEARRYFLELMRYVDPYAACSPSEVFTTLKEFDETISGIESSVISALNSGEAEVRRLKVRLEEKDNQ